MEKREKALLTSNYGAFGEETLPKNWTKKHFNKLLTDFGRRVCSVPLVSRSPSAQRHGGDRWPSGIRRGVAPGMFRVPRVQGDTGRPHILLQGRAIVLWPAPR